MVGYCIGTTDNAGRQMQIILNMDMLYLAKKHVHVSSSGWWAELILATLLIFEIILHGIFVGNSAH